MVEGGGGHGARDFGNGVVALSPPLVKEAALGCYIARAVPHERSGPCQLVIAWGCLYGGQLCDVCASRMSHPALNPLLTVCDPPSPTLLSLCVLCTTSVYLDAIPCTAPGECLCLSAGLMCTQAVVGLVLVA